MKITSEEKELTRRKIIEFSRKIFREKGYEKTSMKMIAKDVGIGVSTLYGYYSSKIDLFISAFVDVLFEYNYDYNRIEVEMEKGFVDGIIELIFSASIEKMKNDREIIRLFYIASISKLPVSEEFRIRRDGGATFYKFVKEIVDFYDSKNKSLCPFSRVEFINVIGTIFESTGIEYLLNPEITEEVFANKFSRNLKIICAGKYEKY